MGVILNFEAYRRDHVRSSASRPRRHGGNCEIIVLPCVRYERWPDGASKPAVQKKKARKRKARAR